MGRLSIPDLITGCFLNNPPKGWWSRRVRPPRNITCQKFCSVFGCNLIKAIFFHPGAAGSFFIMLPSLFASFSGRALGWWGRSPYERVLLREGRTRMFPTDGENMSMGTSTYVKNLFFFFSSCFFFFFSWTVCPFPPFVFWIFLIRPIKKSFHGNMRT